MNCSIYIPILLTILTCNAHPAYGMDHEMRSLGDATETTSLLHTPRSRTAAPAPSEITQLKTELTHRLQALRSHAAHLKHGDATQHNPQHTHAINRLQAAIDALDHANPDRQAIQALQRLSERARTIAEPSDSSPAASRARSSTSDAVLDNIASLFQDVQDFANATLGVVPEHSEAHTLCTCISKTSGSAVKLLQNPCVRCLVAGLVLTGGTALLYLQSLAHKP